MEPFVVIGVGGVLLLSAAQVGPWIWQMRARRRGDHLVGGAQGADVVLHRDAAGGATLRVAITGSRLTVRARQVGDGAPMIGDAPFDSAVAVLGDDVERCAALDAPTREVLLMLVKRGGDVCDGVAQLRPARTAPPAEDPDVDLLLAVRARLRAGLSAPLDRMERLIRGDRRVGVQLAVFEVYLRVAGHEPRALRLARDLLHRSHGALRLRAARFIQEPLSWQFVALDLQEAPYVREAALRALVLAGTKEACDNAIGAALAGPAGLTLAALELLVGPSGVRWATTLREMVREAWIDVDICGGRFRNDPGLGRALMQAFAAHAGPQDETELLEVAFREDNDLADIAWRALARVGTLVAIHVIQYRELSRSENLVARAHRRRTADHALHALRARLSAAPRHNREEGVGWLDAVG